jgi:hypothetical protein
MTSADPYIRFVERVIDALEELIHAESRPYSEHSFDQLLEETIGKILNYHERGDR